MFTMSLDTTGDCLIRRRLQNDAIDIDALSLLDLTTDCLLGLDWERNDFQAFVVGVAELLERDELIAINQLIGFQGDRRNLS
jgi:hypothetical protein